MNGGVQFDYLIHKIDIQEFMQLKKMVEKLSTQQQKEINKR